MRRILSAAFAAAALLLLVGSAAPPPFEPQAVPVACCKTCRKGKACGDSCIAQEKTCHKPPGCACDG